MFQKLEKDKRLYQISVPIIALTGGIGSGKTTVATILESQGFPIINADHLVKTIYQKKSSIVFIEEKFPECVNQHEINFKKLRETVFSVPENKKLIENFIYPQMEDAFIEKLNQFKEKKFVIYDVPLLFERGLNPFVDYIVLAYTDKEHQIKRVMERDSISRELALKIIEAQMSLDDKKKMSHYIVDNSRGLDELKDEVLLLSSKLLAFFNKE
jgi:dephospho-CoA kinase